MKKYLSTFLLLPFFSLNAQNIAENGFVSENPPVLINQSFEKAIIGRFVSILKSDNAKVSLAKITRDSLNYPFELNYEDLLRLNNEPSKQNSFWLTFKIKNETEEAKSLILEADNPLISEIEFFEIRAKESVSNHNYTGNSFEFETRQISHRNFLFQVSLQAGEEKIYYIYLNNKGKNTQLSLNLLTQQAFAKHHYYKQGLIGISLGFLFCLLLMALFVYILILKASFIHLVFYILTLIFFTLNNTGLAVQYIWAKSPDWSENAYFVLLYLNTFFLLRLFIYFLKDYHLKHVVLRIISIIAYSCLLPAFFTFYESMLRAFFVCEFALSLNKFAHFLVFVAMFFFTGRELKKISLFTIGFSLFLLLSAYYLYEKYALQFENYYANEHYLFLCNALSLFLFLALIHKFRIFKNEEDLQKLISVNKLIALNEQKEKNRQFQGQE